MVNFPRWRNTIKEKVEYNFLYATLSLVKLNIDLKFPVFQRPTTVKFIIFVFHISLMNVICFPVGSQ